MMNVLTAIREVQIPLLAAMLLGGSAAKLLRAVRVGSMDAGLGPTALFPTRLRRPAAAAMCAVEFGLGAGLIITAGRLGRPDAASLVRLGAGVLFLVATCALVELRGTRPETGCGCFGDFSSAPVSTRTLARAALLACAALVTIGLGPLRLKAVAPAAPLLAVILAAELVLIAALSPELGEGLVRLGYSEPCELRVLSEYRTLSSLHRSTPWRRYSGLLTATAPVDTWRELCWRYLVFPAQAGGRPAEVVFAVYLTPRRPAVQAALVDAATGQPLPWPEPARPRPLFPWLEEPAARRAAAPAEPAAARLAGPAARPAPGPVALLSAPPAADRAAVPPPGPRPHPAHARHARPGDLPSSTVL